MRRILSYILAAVMAITPALAGPNGQGVGINGTIGTAGQLRGTQTNDNACAGCVGEIIESSVPNNTVSMTTSTITNLTTVSLTPGDWDCRGTGSYLPAGGTTVSGLTTALNTVSVTLPTSASTGSRVDTYTTFTVGTAEAQFAGIMRVNIAVATTVYLIAFAQFAVSTFTGGGYLGCRRMR